MRTGRHRYAHGPAAGREGQRCLFRIGNDRDHGHPPVLKNSSPVSFHGHCGFLPVQLVRLCGDGQVHLAVPVVLRNRRYVDAAHVIVRGVFAEDDLHPFAVNCVDKGGDSAIVVPGGVQLDRDNTVIEPDRIKGLGEIQRSVASGDGNEVRLRKGHGNLIWGYDEPVMRLCIDTSKQDMIDACHALSKLNPTYGVYFVFGNHDKGYYDPEYRGYDGDDLIKELEKNGVHVLQDDVELIDDRFYLIGRQDRSEEQKGGSRASMQKLTENLDTSKYSIVLDHQPHDYDNQAAAKVDLVLSGHTHGGQFFPINYVGEWSGENDKTYGLETRDVTNFIVTSGISDWAIKFKTGCKSEYVVIDIEGK